MLSSYISSDVVPGFMFAPLVVFRTMTTVRTAMKRLDRAVAASVKMEPGQRNIEDSQL